MKRNYSNLKTPIIGRVVVLQQRVLEYTSQTRKEIKHPYVDVLKADCALLFKYAIRQLNKRDYYKRALELIEEIQAQSYLIFALDGFTRKQVMMIDVICDEILSQFGSLQFGENAETKS